MELVNTTPLSGQHLITTDGRGKEILLIVAKGTYKISREVHLLDKQPPIQPVDTYHGPPATSSIKQASELTLYKPKVDVVLLGHAVADRAQATEVQVRFRFGDYWEKSLRVVGPRTWKSSGLHYYPSAPKAIERIALTYEHAFGGIDQSNDQFPEGCASNPVGVGFASRHSRKDFTDQPVPSILPLDRDLQSPSGDGPVVGFGWTAGHWQPRLQYAGTYDEAWLKNTMPLLPEDFNTRYFNAAPEDQQIDELLKAGQSVEVDNVGPEGKLRFELPQPQLQASMCLGEHLEEKSMRCDTVIIHADHATVSLVWRASFDVHQQINDLHWCSLQWEGEAE